MQTFRGTPTLVGLVAVVLALAVGGVAYAARGAAKPAVSMLATPARVGPGSRVTVSATVSGAALCTLSSAPRVAGLPVTTSCEGGTFSHEVLLPARSRKNRTRYRLKLKAAGAGGKDVAITTVEVEGSETVASELVSGFEGSCALIPTGHIECWGSDWNGQLGNGTEEEAVFQPAEVLGITDATQVSAGSSDTCALLADHQVECWGFATVPSLHIGEPDEEWQNGDVPSVVPGISDAVQVAAGPWFRRSEGVGCAVLADGHIDCFPAQLTGPPIEVSGITTATQVAAGGYARCALLSGGGVDCWGANENGVLGDGTTSGPETCPTEGEPTTYEPCSNGPVAVQGISDATQVSVSGSGQDENFACALLATGHVDCWGANEFGQLGDGTTTSSDTPVEVQGISNATQVATGSDLIGHDACAVLSTGHVDCWGADWNDQLGNELTGQWPYYEGHRVEAFHFDVPVEAHIENVATVAPTGEDTCVLLLTGKVQCWGFAPNGGLGDGQVEPPTVLQLTLTPVEALGL